MDILLLANLTQIGNIIGVGGVAGSSLGGEIVLIAIICATLLVIFLVIKQVMRSILAILLNSILGVGALVLLNSVMQMGIPVTVYTLIIALLFGLPGVGTLVILKLFGISLI
jgi:hypothetical protein